VCITRPLATALVAAVALAVAPAAAPAGGYNTVPCWSYDAGTFAALKFKPRRCTLGGKFAYQQVDLVKMRRRSWGGNSRTVEASLSPTWAFAPACA
jgi:hypothetical protein